jgi:hypothetical protein
MLDHLKDTGKSRTRCRELEAVGLSRIIGKDEPSSRHDRALRTEAAGGIDNVDIEKHIT